MVGTINLQNGRILLDLHDVPEEVVKMSSIRQAIGTGNEYVVPLLAEVAWDNMLSSGTAPWSTLTC